MVPLIPPSKIMAYSMAKPAALGSQNSGMKQPVRFRGLEDEIQKGSWFADKRMEYFWTDCNYSSDDIQRAVDSERRIKYLVPSILGQLNNNLKVQEVLMGGIQRIEDAPAASQKEPIAIRDDFFLSKLRENQYVLEYRSARTSVPRTSYSSENASVNRAHIPLKVFDKRVVIAQEAEDPLTRQLTGQRLRLFMDNPEKKADLATQYVEVYLSPVTMAEGDVRAAGEIADVGLNTGLDALRDGARLLDEVNDKITRM